MVTWLRVCQGKLTVDKLLMLSTIGVLGLVYIIYRLCNIQYGWSIADFGLQ